MKSLGRGLLLSCLFLTISKASFAVTESASAVPAYSFNPINVKRDPFFPPEISTEKPLNDLLRYDLNEMNLVAILTGMGAPQAMIVLPNEKTHVVQVGDLIGRHKGKVFKITANEVVVKESFIDFQNRRKTNLTNLVLAQ